MLLMMSDREQTDRVARQIIAEVTREFPAAGMTLDFDTPRGEHEDAIVWITPGTEDREEINEIWGYTIKLVQDAYQDEDVYLVAKMKGVGVIDRERPSDADF